MEEVQRFRASSEEKSLLLWELLVSSTQPMSIWLQLPFWLVSHLRLPAVLAVEVAEEDCLSHRLRILVRELDVHFLFRRFHGLLMIHLQVAHHLLVALVVWPRAFHRSLAYCLHNLRKVRWLRVSLVRSRSDA